MGAERRHGYPRVARVNEILREVISDALVRWADDDSRLGFLTVTGVETAPDLRQATVYFDSLPPTAAEALEEGRVALQAVINQQTRMKRTPRLIFRADPAVAAGEAVERILRRPRD